MRMSKIDISFFTNGSNIGKWPDLSDTQRTTNDLFAQVWLKLA